MPLNSTQKRWRRTARGRLKFELAGVAFSRKAGLAPEDYAEHLWSAGAMEWMGTATPTAREYLLKEAEAFETLYPEVVFKLSKLQDDRAELVFIQGCLGGWGKDQWAMARKLGLGKGHVCRYCRQSFRIWASQLGLEACPEPQSDRTTCILRVRIHPEGKSARMSNTPTFSAVLGTCKSPWLPP
ncbi:MAG: hypothetical protein HY530_01305 [Chloroflexi bacterium]|nr:hypothetical protein [Chloroflexota bacterium]